MRVIGVFNSDGGTFRTMDVEAFAARAVEIFEEHGHELEPRVVAGADLIEQLEKAAADGDMILAGGGDGTISAAAGIAFHKGVALGVLPAGTMNLFARSLQIPLELEAALSAIAGGEVQAVDIATANGRPFVHQFSAGIHAKLVKLRETLTYRSRVGKMMASTRAFFSVVNNAPSFQAEVVTPDGVRRHVTAGISVSNNPLEGALPHAVRLDRGLLGIYVIAPLTPMFLLKLSGAALRGGWKELPEIIDLEIPKVTIRFPRAKKDSVGVLDGELIPLEREVEFVMHPGALKVVVPAAVRATGADGAMTAATPA